jgi:hypothetical protein
MRVGMKVLAPLAGASLLLLGGCTYDYLQRTDRVGYSAGNAVQANIEAQTIDPSKASQYNTKGLGKDGVVLPDAGGTGASEGDAAE